VRYPWRPAGAFTTTPRTSLATWWSRAQPAWPAKAAASGGRLLRPHAAAFGLQWALLVGALELPQARCLHALLPPTRRASVRNDAPVGAREIPLETRRGVYHHAQDQFSDLVVARPASVAGEGSRKRPPSAAAAAACGGRLRRAAVGGRVRPLKWAIASISATSYAIASERRNCRDAQGLRGLTANVVAQP